jgi:hypothetical protein
MTLRSNFKKKHGIYETSFIKSIIFASNNTKKQQYGIILRIKT